MGTWGSKTFDSDTAHELLTDTIEKFKRVIRNHPAVSKTDDMLGRRIVAAIAILSAIVKQIDDAHLSITVNEVKGWRRDYLDWFDKCVFTRVSDEVVNSTTVRKNARITFDDLIECLQKRDGNGERVGGDDQQKYFDFT